MKLRSLVVFGLALLSCVQAFAVLGSLVGTHKATNGATATVTRSAGRYVVTLKWPNGAKVMGGGGTMDEAGARAAVDSWMGDNGGEQPPETATPKQDR